MSEEHKKIIVGDRRPDGRALDEMRPITAKAGVISRANGSAHFAMGSTVAIAAAYGPRELHPKHLQDPVRAYLKYVYAMAPFSTQDRVKPGPSRRSTEISEVSRQAFNSVIFLEEFPKAGIEVFVEILQANASTRCAGINAASIALADAGVPMTDLVSSCAAGKVDGKIILDVAGEEDTEGEVDMPIAYIPRKDEIALLQMDGLLTLDEFKEALELAKKGCMQIHEKQVAALKERYVRVASEIAKKGPVRESAEEVA
ncbi:MAG: exosome complex exonuclease Rrp41 [Candidatus Aenigmatarchaeota archaeon]|nr:MAG: exosome complex exonuclease Rrp41 [Candidatus Aenigmarchaeota archaeon]